MCGLSGIIHLEGAPVLQVEIEAMQNAIAHRGPDGRGVYINENIGLGHVRLSIIDLRSVANQPMQTKDGTLVIIFNGEIYNYRYLREKLKKGYNFETDSDTEVILAAYQAWGETCLDQLNGMFSFVIYDRKNNKIFCARDRFGIKPFYYLLNEEHLLFSSEIKGILASGYVKAEVNDEVLYDFVVFNRTDHITQTCFKHILNLRPGHKLVVDMSSNDVTISSWYSLPSVDDVSFDFETCKTMLRHYLDESVALHLIGDVPVGSALSGGVDSSTIVSLMKDLLPSGTPIHSFSAIYDDQWDRNEKPYMEACVSEKELSPNFVSPNSVGLLQDFDAMIRQQEEPFASSSMYASWCVYREAQNKKIKVLLNGQGSDEVFAYDYMAAFYFFELFKRFHWITLIRETTMFFRKQSDVAFTFKLFAFLLSPRFLKRRLIRMSDSAVNNFYHKQYYMKSIFHETFFASSTLNENVRKHLQMKLHHLLRVEDKNSMHFGVEARVPFLEHRLVEFGMNIPSKFKVRNGEVKYVLKESVSDLLPKKVYKRNNKIGYETPMDSWFREPDFVQYMNTTLAASVQPMAFRLNIPVIKAKWEAHLSGRENNGAVLWKYLYLTRWYQLFFQSN
jgi:asparagine synthase (glutamine-hydrolysing)